MRTPWLLYVAACVVLSIGGAAWAQPAPLLTAEELGELTALQKSTIPPIASDKAFLTRVFNRSIDAIMKASLFDAKIAGRDEAIEVMLTGKGDAKGGVSNVFRDLSAEVVAETMATRWKTLDAADWLGRMNVVMVISALSADGRVVVFTALEQGLGDPSPAVRYHAAKGLWPLRSQIISTVARYVTENRPRFLATILKRAGEEPDDVVRRALYRLLLMQQPPGGPQNNVTADALVQVASARLDKFAALQQMPDMPEGQFAERADLELAGVLGVSLAGEPNAEVKRALAQQLARLIILVARDHARANLPEHYQVLLAEILLAADGSLVKAVPGTPPLLTDALKKPTLGERRAAAELAAGTWVIQHMVGAFGIEIVIPPVLPEYGKPATVAPPAGLLEGPGGGLSPTGPGLLEG